MMKIMKEKMKKRKGFTLVELVVVIAILGILAAIAVPKLSESRTSAANSAHNSNRAVLESAATMYLAQKGMPAADVTITWDKTDTSRDAATGWGPYLQRWPDVPKGSGIYSDVAAYKVTIDDKGNIKVEPAVVSLD